MHRWCSLCPACQLKPPDTCCCFMLELEPHLPAVWITTHIMYWILCSWPSQACKCKYLFLLIPSQSPPINHLITSPPTCLNCLKNIFFSGFPRVISHSINWWLILADISQQAINEETINVSSNKPLLPKWAENDCYPQSQSSTVFFLDHLEDFRGSFQGRVKGRKLLQELQAYLWHQLCHPNSTWPC